MKKRGFTLAEVLITLGIIGVVAALTAPALVMNSRNEANAAKLSVTVSNLENAFTNAIAQEGVDSLYRTQMWPSADIGAASKEDDIAKFVGGLGKYIHTNGFVIAKNSEGTVETKKYYEGKGPYKLTSNGGTDTSKIEEHTLGSCFPIELKNGAVVWMIVYANGDGHAKASQDEVAHLGGSLWSDAADVYIDVNGKVAPNAYGRDIFHFYLGNNGILYPVGGMDVSIYDNGNRENVWSNKDKGWSCVDGNIKDGLGCTARLISEGYKMNY